MFILGVALLSLALFTDLIPFGELFGLSYNLLAIILGAFLILFAFWLWRRSKRTPGDISGMGRRQMRREFGRGIRDKHSMREGVRV